jgi:hypothetical protein
MGSLNFLAHPKMKVFVTAVEQMALKKQTETR